MSVLRLYHERSSTRDCQERTEEMFAVLSAGFYNSEIEFLMNQTNFTKKCREGSVNRAFFRCLFDVCSPTIFPHWRWLHGADCSRMTLAVQIW